MKNQSKFLIIAALILAAIYAYRFTDWFQEKKIQIKYRSLVERGSAKSSAADSITFYLEAEQRLTSIKVISADEAATNKYPHAYWHLVSDSNSLPVVDFMYGANLAGMKPKIAGLMPQPLESGANYRILIEAGKVKGEKDFQPR